MEQQKLKIRTLLDFEKSTGRNAMKVLKEYGDLVQRNNRKEVERLAREAEAIKNGTPIEPNTGDIELPSASLTVDVAYILKKNIDASFTWDKLNDMSYDEIASLLKGDDTNEQSTGE